MNSKILETLERLSASHITIEGDVPEAARARLMEIADRCPVHDTLTREIKIRSRLVS